MESLDATLGHLENALKKCEANPSKSKNLGLEIEYYIKVINGQDLSSCTEEMRDRVVNTVTLAHNVSVGKVDRVRDLLLNLENKVQVRNVQEIGTVSQQVSEIQSKLAPATDAKISCTMSFFCDIDAPDHNGAILMGVFDALNNPMPFITSLSLLNGSFISKDKGDIAYRVRHHLDHVDKWDIYLGEGEYVVFIPKGGKLEDLDLKNDGSLQKISAAKALSGYQRKPTFEAFERLFSENPKHSKLFYHDGHGGPGSPGGMSRKVFEKYLAFLKKQKCQGMALTSCYSGGQSTLNFLSNAEDLEQKVPFPVMAQSIGDFVTKSGQAVEFSMKDRLAMMKSLIEQHSGLTYKKWQKALKELEAGKKEKSLQNQVQLYFPHSPKSPAGFRPPEEVSGSYSLTMNKLGKAIYEGLKLSNISHFAVFPLVVDVPIAISGKMPLLISQFPGQTRHYFKDVTVEDFQGVQPWMKEMKKLYADTPVRKAFFIEKLKGSQETIEHLAVYCGPLFTQCVYKKGSDCFFFDGETQQQISPLQYALEVEKIIKRTTPLKRAEIAGTAGQQSDNTFIEKVRDTDFFPKIEQKDFDRLDLKDQQAILINLSEANKEDIIIQRMEENGLSANFAGLNGEPILNNAVLNNSLRLIQFLIAKGADLNAPGLQKRTPLHNAANRGDPEILELLLKAEGIDKNPEDDEGKIPLRWVSNDELIPLFRQYGCNFDEPDNEGMTSLGAAIYSEDYEEAEALIREKANLDAGNPSPLLIAITSGDVEPIKMLLNAGAKGFEKDAKGRIPFVECIYRGTEEQVAAFLEKAPQNSEHLNDQCSIKGLLKTFVKTPLDAALFRRNGKIIRDCLAAGIDKYGCDVVALTDHLIPLAKEDPELIKILLKKGLGDALALHLFVATIAADPAEAEELIKQGLFTRGPNLGLYGDIMIIKAIYKNGTPSLLELVKKTLDIEHSATFSEALPNPNKEMLKYLLDQGVPGHQFSSSMSGIPKDVLQWYLKKNPDISRLNSFDCLSSARFNKDEEVFKILVEAGMDLNATRYGGPKILPYLLEQKKFDLIKFSFDHGLKLNPSDQNDAYVGALSIGKEGTEFLHSLGIEIAPDQIRFDQKLKAILKYRDKGDLELLKLALSLGFNPMGASDYDPKIVKDNSYELSSFLNTILEKKDSEALELIRPFLDFLKTDGPEDVKKKVEEFFTKWNAVL